MPRRKTQEEFVADMKLINPDIEVLGEYINKKTKIKCRCKQCNNVWDAMPSNLTGHHTGCPNCSSNKRGEKSRKSHEQFVKDMQVIHPEIEILGEYITSKTKVKCKCKSCNNIWEMKPNALLGGQGCPSCSRKSAQEKHTLTNNEFIERLEKIKPTYTVLDEYKNCETKVRCICDICNGEWKVKPIHLLNGRGCPICIGKKCVHGINDIATLRPDLIKYFINEEDATKYTVGSSQRLIFRCPDCGHEKEMVISQLVNNGFSCDICCDNISYPNKYLRGFLQQLLVDNIDYEYSPKWLRPYRYDSYFTYKSLSYIVEMDGGLGHGNYQFGSTNKDIEGLKIDRIKDDLATSHNIKVIRIDCLKSESDYISNNILNSELSEIFDLSNIDWNLCNEYATKNIVKEVCNYYNQSTLSARKVAEKLKIGHPTVIRYLYRGNELGWCNYIPNSRRSKRTK